MNSFGLGLVLNFIDNASSGMGSASRTFQQMSATADNLSFSITSSISDIVTASYALDQVGSTMMSAGSSILNLYGSISQSVIDTGMEMQGFRMQLSALYGSVEAGEAKLEEIKQYAMTSVFDVQSLIPAVTTMKAVGIEAMDEITTSSGKHTQKLLDYASDIAAMVPNMRNAYGTGVRAAMGALKEYIAEGNALSLKRGAGFDITGILGEGKGSTMEERSRQIADLVEKLNIVGYTAQLAGTPTQRLSNMQDALFNSLAKIADSGVFEVYCAMLEKLSNWVSKLVNDEETFNTITGVLADTITTVLSPLNSLLDFLIENGDAIIQWIKNNPLLTKSILIVVASIGALLVVSGALLKIISSIGMAFAGLSFIASFPAIFTAIGGGLAIVSVVAVKLIALAGAFYYAWKNNLFDIQTSISNFATKFVSAISLISDAWGDYSLSIDNYEKAKNLGLLPLIETILDLKYRFDFFKQGFVKGWKEISDKVTTVMDNLSLKFSGSIFEPIIEKVKLFFETLSSSDTSAWTRAGEVFATITAGVAGLVTAVSLISALSKGFAPIIASVVLMYAKSDEFRKIFGDVVDTVYNNFLNNVSVVVQSFKDIAKELLPTIKTIKDSFMDFLPKLSSFMGEIATFVTKLIGQSSQMGSKLLPPIFKVVGSVVKAVFEFLPVIMDIGSTIFGVIGKILPVITNLIDMLIPFIESLATMWSTYIGNILVILVDVIQEVMVVVTDLIDLVVPMIARIAKALTPVIQTIMNIVQNVASRLMPIFQELFSIVSEIIKVVVAILGPIIGVILQIAEVIISVLLPILDVILTVIGVVIDTSLGIIQIVVTIVSTIVQIISGIVRVLWSVLNAVIQAIMVAVRTIAGVITTLVSSIATILKGIITVVQTIWDGIVAIFLGVVDFFGGIFGGVADVIIGVFRKVSDFFTNMWTKIVDAFSTIGDTISGVIRGAINTVIGGAVGIINGFIEAINFAISAINLIPGVEITKLTLLEAPKLAKGGVVDRPTPAIFGEDGAEAVVPLEKNTEWIDKVAQKVAPKLLTEQRQISPVSADKSPQEVHNDYSVTFSAGSVVIQLSNASDAELEKAAEKLMKIIERKQQLKKMAVRKA